MSSSRRVLSAAGGPAGSVVLALGRGFGTGRGVYLAPARPHAHVARRHHGGNGVLVNHLADGVAQQHHELVERFDGALQLDAVDEVDRNRNALAAQRVQERVLQGLPLGHWCFPSLVIVVAAPPAASSTQHPLAVTRRWYTKAHRHRRPGRQNRTFAPIQARPVPGRPRNSPIASRSPPPSVTGSNQRASSSPRSQVSWRLASWRVAAMARSRKPSASVAPSRY